MDLRMMRFIVGLPLLHTLHVTPDTSYPSPLGRTRFSQVERVDWKTPDAAAMWTLLSTAPALTSLHIAAIGEHRLTAALNCTKLVDLKLRAPTLTGDRGHRSFAAFFLSPNMLLLRSLTFELFSAATASPPKSVVSRDVDDSLVPDYASVFSSLHHLHTLNLRFVDRVDLLLPSLRHCSSLLQLFVCPGCALRDVERLVERGLPSTVPTPVVLGALLTAAPSLHCTIQFAPLKQHRQAPNFVRGYAAAASGDQPSVLARLSVTHSNA
jgi:hypothetical protein